MFTTRIKAIAASLLLLGSVSAFSQPRTVFLGPMQGENHGKKGFAYQGMEVRKNTVVSLQNQGIATVYDISKGKMKVLGQFHLGSFNAVNHANVASFGTSKASCRDKMPLLYVSHCHKKRLNGYKDACYVERLSNDFSGSTLVQTIVYDDVAEDYGYALQWVVDRERKHLIGYGNTVSNSSPENRHRVIVFPLPKLSDGETVFLKAEDAVENYTIEEASGFSFNPIGQGLCVKKGKLYMPTGLGTKEHPSILYIWNLEKKSMETVDLSGCTSGELEDISVYGNKFLLQGQDGLWILKL